MTESSIKRIAVAVLICTGMASAENLERGLLSTGEATEAAQAQVEKKI
jgi:hypothetical protein